MNKKKLFQSNDIIVTEPDIWNVKYLSFYLKDSTSSLVTSSGLSSLTSSFFSSGSSGLLSFAAFSSFAISASLGSSFYTNMNQNEYIKHSYSPLIKSLRYDIMIFQKIMISNLHPSFLLPFPALLAWIQKLKNKINSY